MSDLRTAALRELEEYDAHDPLAVVMEDLRTALAERDELLEVVRDAITTLDRSGYTVAAEELRSAVAEIKSLPSPGVPSHSQTSGSRVPTP